MTHFTCITCFFARDWGSPLGKEFTNVGEGFCFSDAVQRSSHSPIKIDHPTHKKSSTVMHPHSSSSQSGGQGRSSGRGGGEGPSGGGRTNDGGANGQQEEERMLGMGEHHTGEGDRRPSSSSSSSSNHHMHTGNTSNTSNHHRQNHGSSLHVHTTGSELEPTSPHRRGPQSSSSGTRGMHHHRGVASGESDMMVSHLAISIYIYSYPLTPYFLSLSLPLPLNLTLPVNIPSLAYLLLTSTYLHGTTYP